MKNLYKVNLEFTILVVADSEREAEKEAEYYLREDGNKADLIFAQKIQKIDDIPEEWKDSIPFGDKRDDRTCRERMANEEK